jgi:acyl-CoA dehydrogenase
MSLALTDEQELLRETAREFATENSPVTAFRELRDSVDAVGFSRPLWTEMAELGWVGVIIPEEFGGSGLGYRELGILLEECGRTLMCHPFLSTVLLAGNAILLGGSQRHKAEILPEIAKGERILALAFQETGRFAPYAVSTKAEAIGTGFRISGEKLFVLDGHVADTLVVVARTGGDSGDRNGISLFVVDAKSENVDITRTIMVDGRNAARIQLNGVEVTHEDVIGQVDAGAELLDAVFERATLGLSAEMLGSIQESFDRTIEYVKTREQFGVPIGSFQALKHRAAEMFCELELSHSVVRGGLQALDEGSDSSRALASAAKARVSDTGILVGCEAVQMFGGIGMTDEEEIGLFLKRLHAAAVTLGDASYHRSQFADQSGF